jgi:mutator protein MutT
MDKYIFKVPQKAIIKKDDKYLILKRSPDAITYPNHWDFPGGKTEAGEGTSKGLEREVMEETSLEIRVIEPVFTFHEVYNGTNLIFIFYSCEVTEGEIKLSHEHTEYKWATKEEILKLKTENFLSAFFDSV